jgi:branched-chain amino acid transport system substrate-binding protein
MASNKQPGSTARRGLLLACGVVAAALAGVTPALADSGKPPLKLGLIGTLTGFNSVLGEDTRKGAELAIEELNRRGGVDGRRIELKSEDDENDPQKAVTAAHRLIESEHVAAIVGPMHSAYARAVSQVTREAKVVQIAPISTMDALTNPINPYLFRVWVRDSDVADLLASLAVKYQKIGVLYETTPWGQGGKDGLVKQLKAHSREPASVQAFDINSRDLTPQVRNLKKDGADVVLIQAQGADAAQALRAMRQLGYKPQVLGHPGLTMESFVQLARGLSDGTVVLDGLDPAKPQVREFQQAYKARYGKEAYNFFAAAGYDAVMLLVEGLKNAGNDSARLQAGMEKISGYKGIIGRPDSVISYSATDHDGYGASDMVLKRYGGGQMHVVKELAGKL